MVYEPHEDSQILAEFVGKYASGNVLDMGTGSGIQAITAAHSSKVKKVYAADIDPAAIKFAKEQSNDRKHKKIKWLISDLFSEIPKKHFFDTIIFNPPYLPQESKQRHIDLEGGKQGYETIERFLQHARHYLSKNGKILLVYSSLTPRVHDLIEQNLFQRKELGKTHMFFETVSVDLLTVDPVIEELEKKGICNMHYYARGKRGLVFTGNYRKKKVAIKIKRQQSTATNTILHEAAMLKEVNKHGIGPKYLFNTPHALVYKFVEGKPLKDCTKQKNIKFLCKKILSQCFTLDKMRINKQEMTRPYKHAIMKGNKVTLIDFERARKIPEPHNVTQFIQYINHYVKPDKRWINIARKYNRERTKTAFKQIQGMLNG
ncbi:methyltransferase [Candidatus Woesearchaeota archaeon]|nr:methyltransferase [Candidatus Woesearchaeota archaeon]